jgi:hypothetical protein
MPTLGLGTIVQLLPFQDSISGCPMLSPPVAMHIVALVHETPMRSPALGIGTIDQVVPFQVSIRVPSLEFPTAVQLVVLRHETPLRLPEGSLPPTLGLGTTDHVESAA